MNTCQRGTSLVSLMIGMLLSMCIVLTLLTFYKQLIWVALQSTRSAQQEGQISTGLMTLQMEIQSAGYGLDPASTPHIASAPLALPLYQNALLWRFKDGSSLVCQGIYEKHEKDPETGLDTRKIMQLRGKLCSSLLDLREMTWEEDGYLTEFKNHPEPVLSFSITQKVCMPYGLSSDNAKRTMVTISLPAMPSLSNQPAQKMTYALCLINTSQNPN